jgi:spheroidene monooxygenase
MSQPDFPLAPHQSVTLSLYRYGPISDRVWAFAQMGLARWGMARLPGQTFWKLLGSGQGEGFTPVPNTAVYGVLCVWDDAEAARAGLARPVFRRFARRAAETCTLHLRPLSARGRWSGAAPFRPEADGATPGPLAALTRGTVRTRDLMDFWRRVPDISRMIGDNRDVRLKIGLGEVPFLHQVTFSIWPDAEAMARFARVSGPHAAAIRAVRDGDWFAEELYARFAVSDATGVWEGRPLTEVLA